MHSKRQAYLRFTTIKCPPALGAAKDSDPVSVETTEELLRCLEAGSVAPSDLLALGRLKALLLLRDTESLRGALDALPGRCALPPGTWPPARLPFPRVGRAGAHVGPEHLSGTAFPARR